MEHRLVIGPHAYKQAALRCGFNPPEVYTMAQAAYIYGSIIFRGYESTRYFYKGNVFVFSGNFLITVYEYDSKEGGG